MCGPMTVPVAAASCAVRPTGGGQDAEAVRQPLIGSSTRHARTRASLSSATISAPPGASDLRAVFQPLEPGCRGRPGRSSRGRSCRRATSRRPAARRSGCARSRGRGRGRSRAWSSSNPSTCASRQAGGERAVEVADAAGDVGDVRVRLLQAGVNVGHGLDPVRQQVRVHRQVGLRDALAHVGAVLGIWDARAGAERVDHEIERGQRADRDAREAADVGEVLGVAERDGVALSSRSNSSGLADGSMHATMPVAACCSSHSRV